MEESMTGGRSRRRSSPDWLSRFQTRPWMMLALAFAGGLVMSGWMHKGARDFRVA